MDCELCGRHRPSAEILAVLDLTDRLVMACGRCVPRASKPAVQAASGAYITLKVSTTWTDAPPARTGQPLAISTAASSEPALMME